MTPAIPIVLWHWTMWEWVIALIIAVWLMSKWWRWIIGLAVIVAVIGWSESIFAGFTGLWFVGWFVWVIPFTAILVSRLAWEYLMRLPYVPNKENE